MTTKPHARKTTAKVKTKRNPLYVVTNEGKTVEEAFGFFDAMIKRFSLGPVIGLLETILKEMTGLVTNFQMFALFKAWLDEWVNWLSGLVNATNPRGA
jgi:hypothetical protein